MRAHTFAAGLAVAAAGCHVRVRSEVNRPIVIDRIPHLEGAIARKPALVWSDTGGLRFVEPLECPTEERYRLHTTVDTAVRPNLATVTVGVIAAALGGVMLTSGLFSDHPSGSPYTWLGAGGLAVGLPFAIGPFVHTGTETADLPDGAPLRRPGASQPCGDRPLAARAATLDVAGLSIHGAIDRDGGFAVSPYDWLDAFDPASAQGAELTAHVDAAGGPRTITAVLDRAAVIAHAAAFLQRAGISPAIDRLTVLPALSPGAITATLVDGPALRVALALRNTGAGPAFAVRGQITAPGLPAIDGRMLYVGRVLRGEAVQAAVVIPLAPAAADALRGAPLALSIELRDAYGSAPTTALTFRGTLP